MSSFEKVFFLHIPKTGGESVNHLFRQSRAQEQYVEHMENLDPSIIGPEFLEGKTYVSGHIPFPRVRHLFGKPSGWNLITFVRDPFDHLLSHLSWTRNLFFKPTVFLKVPPETQRVSRIMSETDFNDFASMEAFFKDMPSEAVCIFDNRQVRYFSDPDDYKSVSEVDCQKAMETADQFDYVGVFDDYDHSMRALIDRLPFEASTDAIPHKNKSNPKIVRDESLLPVLREMTKSLTSFDYKLYQRIKTIRAQG